MLEFVFNSFVTLLVVVDPVGWPRSSRRLPKVITGEW
jgi:hypothetical protein